MTIQRRMFVALAFLGACASASPPASATLSLLDLADYPTARCMDGTPGGFYFRAATAPANISNWVFSLEGGGECVTQAECDSRLTSSLGSSKYFTKTTELGQFQSGDPAYNPDLATYNMVFIKYCSSDLHSGTMHGPSNQTWGLQFSGFNIVKAVINTLVSTHNLGASGTRIVWSGDSAGGIGCVATVDAVRDMLPLAYIVGAPIGGFYFSNDEVYNATSPPPVSFIPWTFTDLKTYAALWQSFVPTRCAALHPADPWTCLFAVNSYSSIASPMFIIEAQTDEVVMPLHDGLPDLWDHSPSQCRNTVDNCPPSVIAFMHQWQGQMETALVSQIKPTDGVFHPACLIHTEFSWIGPLINGKNFIAAFGDWLFNRSSSSSSKFIDSCGVMCNPSCNKTAF